MVIITLDYHLSLVLEKCYHCEDRHLKSGKWCHLDFLGSA